MRRICARPQCRRCRTGDREISLSESDRFEMVNLRSRSSGLPMNIWLGPRGRARHGPGIKVQMDHRAAFDLDHLAVVSVEDTPRVAAGHLTQPDLDLIRRYMALNRRAILDHWNGETDGLELAVALVKLT